VIALDTNILVYAVRQEVPYHRQALKLVTSLAERSDPWAIPWPCVYEFLRVVTHPKLFRPPGTIEDALRSVAQLRESPSLVLLGDGPAHFRYALKAMRDSAATGNLVHDAHIAALCLEHGVSELYTMDRDFSRFRGLKITYPFPQAGG
jgi:toxin-antitoxin system PIN domain toxin